MTLAPAAHYKADLRAIRFTLYDHLKVDRLFGLEKFAHRMRLTRGNQEVFGSRVLHNPPHPLHVLFRVTPISFCVEVAEKQFFLKTANNTCDGAGNLPSDKCLTAPRRFVVWSRAWWRWVTRCPPP